MIRVLHVDDDVDLLELAKLFLEQAGELAVETETSPMAALERIGEMSCMPPRSPEYHRLPGLRRISSNL